MAILRHIQYIFIATLLTGCYENFDPATDTTPLICINSMITAGEPIEVKVSKTWKFNDLNDEKEHNVDDATIHIFANGEPCSDNYIPQEGDEIHIVAESRKYGRAEASVKVPVSVAVSAISFKASASHVWKNYEHNMVADVTFSLHVSMGIEDCHDTDNYFLLDYPGSKPYVDNPDNDPSDLSFSKLYLGLLDYNAEPIFKEHIGVFETVFGVDDESFLVFSDRQFSGKTYNLSLKFDRATYKVNAPHYDESQYDREITFCLATISRSFYDYSIYRWQRDSGTIGDLSDLGFAQPMWGYSNVSSGAGVVAARSLSTCTINLKDFLKTTLDNPGQ